MQTGVYEIRNTLNGHRYIGSAMSIERRWVQHTRELRKGIHHSAHLQNAWNKYGEDVFEFSIIELVFPWALTMREQYFMDTLSPEYNILPTAGSCFGRKHTDETRQKIGEARKGKTRELFSAEWIRRLSNAHKGQRRTDETKKKISEALKGRTLSDETRQRVSDSKKGQKHYGRISSEAQRKKQSESMKGKIPWNKGRIEKRDENKV